MSLNMYSLVDLNKSPFVAEMNALKEHEFTGEQIYFNPTAMDKNVDDISQIEARLVRLIFRLVEYDPNYTGIVDLQDEVINLFAVGTKFSKPMLYTALKHLKANVNKGDCKPLIVQHSNRSRVYWVNPSIICKKSLIDKFVEQQKNAPDHSDDEKPDTVVIDDEEEATTGNNA